jgi:hypothetical protein
VVTRQFADPHIRDGLSEWSPRTYILVNQSDLQSSTAGRSEVIQVVAVGNMLGRYVWILLLDTLFFKALAVTL